RFTERRWAISVISKSVVFAVIFSIVIRGVNSGNLEPDSPFSRADSRCIHENPDVITHSRLCINRFVVSMKTDPDCCRVHQTLQTMDRLAWQLRQTPGVQTTSSLAESTRFVTSGMAEGSGKWLTISRDQAITNASVDAAMISSPGITNQQCSVTPLIAYLTD